MKSVVLKLIEDSPQRVAFSVRNSFHFNGFPRNSALKLKLYENKGIETLLLGQKRDLCDSSGRTIAIERTLENEFSRPACQIRIIQTVGPMKGLVLGATPVWTMRSTSISDGDVQSTGILKFAVDNLDPHTWTLRFPETDYPTVYLDRCIPNAKAWVRNDPVFISFVLPAIIRQIFERILESQEYSEVRWMRDWVEWAKTVGVEDDLPTHLDTESREKWIEDIVSGFAVKNRIHQRLIRELTRD